MPAGDEALLPYALCAHEDVQTFLVAEAKPGPAPVITRLINLFSDLCQGPEWMNIELEYKERIAYIDIGNGTFKPLVEWGSFIQLPALPIAVTDPVSVEAPPTPLIEVWNSDQRVYNNASKLALYTDFTVDVKRAVLRHVSGCWIGGPAALKVKWTGGLVKAPTGNERPSAPADLRWACAMQVAAWWQRRKELNLESVAFPGGGAVRLNDPTKLLSTVRTTIQKYRSFRMV